MRLHSSVHPRAERRAAPKSAHATGQRPMALWPSKLTQASLEPRPSFPSGDRPAYSPGEGLQ